MLKMQLKIEDYDPINRIKDFYEVMAIFRSVPSMQTHYRNPCFGDHSTAKKVTNEIRQKREPQRTLEFSI